MKGGYQYIAEIFKLQADRGNLGQIMWIHNEVATFQIYNSPYAKRPEGSRKSSLFFYPNLRDGA
jgi:hypothetical protein